MSVIQPTNFNTSNLTISDAKKLDNGSSQAWINYSGKKLRVQAPRMPVPMDASDYKENGKFKVNLSFRDRNSNPKVDAYYKMLEAIDEFIIDTACKNSGPWFKKPNMSRDLVIDRFTPSIRFAKDKDGKPKDYPPTQPVALKKNYKTGAFDAELYDKEKRLIEGRSPVDVLKRGSEITPILECTGIWITDKGFGATWKLFQGRVDVSAEGIEPGCAIMDDDEEESENTSKKVPVVAKPVASNIIDDDEEEDLMAAVNPDEKVDEDVDEDEVVEAPPPPAPKKVSKAAPAASEPVAAAPKKVVKAADAASEPKKVVKKVTKA